MSNLIHSPTIPLTRGITSNPFATLLIESAPANMNLSGRTQHLKDFCVTLKEIEETTEAVLTRNHWLSIASGFSASAAVAGSAAMVPLAGILVSGAAVVAAVTAIADSYLTKSKIEPVCETLTRHRIALESQKIIHWAALWEIAGTDLFCKAVSYSARGSLLEGKLVQQGSDSPFVRAADYAAEALGATYDAVIDAIDATIMGRLSPQLQTAHVNNVLPQSAPRALPVADAATSDTIPTQSAPTQIQPPIYQPTAPTVIPGKKQPSAYSEIMGSPDISRVIFGFQRTGKSYLLAVASQQLQLQRGFTVYHINLDSVQKGAAVKEDEQYWGHTRRSIRADLGSLNPDDAQDVIDEAISTVEEWWQDTSAILIVDEWATQASIHNTHSKALQPLNSMLAARISTLTSTGVKRERAIWVISPECVVMALTQEGKAFKKLKLCYLTIPPKKFVEWNGGKITFDDSLFRDVSRNFSLTYPEGRFNEDRIAYIDGRWMSIGDLPPLDPTLRPAVVPAPAQAVPAPSPQPTQTGEYSEEQKKAAQAAMVQSLRATSHHTLWEFARDEWGCKSSDEIKETLQAIANLIFDNDLTALKEKFRLSSKWDIRYSYAGYRHKLSQVHGYTGNVCSCCLERQSENGHHTRYEGANDEPGKNLINVCKPCHDSLCHSPENWIKGDIWQAHNIPEWEAKLQAGFQLLATRGGVE